MPIAKSAKINIIAHRKDQESLLDKLQDLAFIEFEKTDVTDVPKKEITDQLATLDYQLAGIQFAIKFLTPFAKSDKEASKTNVDIDAASLELQVKKFDFEKAISQAQEAEKIISENEAIIQKLLQDKQQLLPWEGLTYNPSEIKLSHKFAYYLIQAGKTEFENFETDLEKITRQFSIEKIAQSGEGKKSAVRAILTYQAQDQQLINDLLEQFKIETVGLPEFNSTVKDRLTEIAKEIAIATENIKNAKEQTKTLAKHLPNLKIAFDYLNWKVIRLQGLINGILTENVISLTAWLDEKLISRLEQQLKKVTENFVIERLPIGDDEAIPVILKNRWAKPFEVITTMYGTPQTGPDPTPFLAPFFTLFFGLALTDAGYGIALAITALVLMKVLKIQKEGQKLFWVLFWGGIASFIIGVFTGGWFAADLETLPAVIADPLKSLVIINPLENPIAIFYLSLALGITQVLFGILIDMFWKIRNGKALDGLTGSGLWFLLIVFILIFSGSSMGMLPSSLAVTKWLAIASAVGIVVATAAKSKNFFLGLPTGIISLYGFAGYFSDVLSYSRLLALGLTTGIIGLVVNLMASLVYGIPWVGWLVALIVLIGGHTFNLGINALGAFIHSSRLQYIEFFPKFMEGGGRMFSPFRKEARYVRIVNNN